MGSMAGLLLLRSPGCWRTRGASLWIRISTYCLAPRVGQLDTVEDFQMKLTDLQHAEFKVLTRPLIEWLNANFNPHVKVIVEVTGAELTTGVACYTTDDFIRDF